MSWLLPTPLVLFAGVVALLPLAALVRRSVSGPRLMVETFAVTLAVIAVVWAGLLALWLIEQHW